MSVRASEPANWPGSDRHIASLDMMFPSVGFMSVARTRARPAGLVGRVSDFFRAGRQCRQSSLRYVDFIIETHAYTVSQKWTSFYYFFQA